MSGSGEGGFWTRNISLYNPDPARLYNVSVTPHLWQSSHSATDSLSGLARGYSGGGARSSSWNPSLSKSGRMAFVVDWFREGNDAYHIVAQNRDATDRVVLAGPYPAGGGQTDRAYRPSISPDGQTVIYTVTRGEVGQLYRVPSDGSGEPELISINDPDGCSSIIQAVFHPDRDEIAFLGYSWSRDETLQNSFCTPAVRVMDVDGSNVRDVYVNPNLNYNAWHLDRMVIDWKADRILFGRASRGRHAGFGSMYEIMVVDDSTGQIIATRPSGATGRIGSSYQLSPDGRHVAYATESAADCWIVAEDLESGEVVLDLTDVLNTGQYCYLNWADAPAIPEPARYELSETELVLWDGQATQVLPTLYDVDGNVIVHEVRRFTGTVSPHAFRVNRLEHMYHGWTGNITNREQCFLNAGFEACFIVWNAETPIFRMEALTDTVYEATGSPADLRIYRIGNPRPANIDVLHRNGSAIPFRDFVLDVPSRSISFQEGVYERTLRLTPIENGVVTANRFARISLQPTAGNAIYSQGNAHRADIWIIDSGVSSTSLAVTGVAPARGGSRGTVELRAVGRAFGPNASLYLERGGTRITVTDAEVNNRYGQSTINGRADLRNHGLGLWDVVVESGGNRAVLPNAFEIIESPPEPVIFSGVYGHRFVSIRQLGHTYRVRISNGGDTDIYDVMAHIWAHPEVHVELRNLADFDDAEYDADVPEFFNRGDYQIAPIWIYRLPANETVEIPIFVRVPSHLLGEGILFGVTHNPPNPDHAFTWTGILDHENETLPWNLGVALGRYAHFAEDFGETAGKVMFCPTPPSPPAPPGSPGSPCPGFGSDGPSGNQADDAWNLANDLQNDRRRFFQATATIPQYGMQKAATSVAKRFFGKFGECAANWAIGSMTGMRSDADFAGKLGFGPGAGGGGNGGSSACPPAVTSWDPNDKLGLTGEGEGRHLRAIAEMPYQIRFENVDSASAPAQIVIITDTLDTAVFDINTFRLGAIEVAEEVIANPPHGVTTFSTMIDRRPEFNHRLHIHANLERDDDRNFARVVWTLTTLEPSSDEPPNDPMEGFLPPNKTAPEGEGSVRFYIRPHDHLPHGREISNHAEIVFDSNAPIVTPVWTNTLDFAAPSSVVVAVERTETDGVWEVEWDGSDSGSGIRDFGIFVQKDGGPFELWTVSRETSALFEGDPDAEYGFFAMSVDWVGNVEDGKTRAEMTTSGPVSTDEASELPRVHALHANYPNPFNPSTIIPFDLPEAGHVRLEIFDLLGRHIETIVDAEMAAGRHTASFNASRHASGIYLVRISAGSFTSTRQVTLVK
jgi:hypothetical protein